MRINARVKPNSKKERVIETGSNNFILQVKPAAKENKANERAGELLSRHFGIPKSQITIFRGKNSRNKIIDIQLNR